MKKISIIFTITCMILLAACEKTITIDIPDKPSRLVINGLLEKNQPIVVSIGKSRGVLESTGYMGNFREQYTVKDAQPVVYENNVAIDTLVYHPTEYLYKTKFNKTIRDGFTYSIKVTAPGFTMAEASSVLPSQSTIAEVKLQRNVRTNSSGMSLDEITIRLNDPAAEKNFYLIQVYTAWGPFWNTAFCVGTTDKDIESIGDDTDPLDPDNCFDGDRLLMKDVNFNGGQKLLKLTVESMGLREYVDQSTGQVYRPYVKVYRITEDQFKYTKTYGAFDYSGENPFAEPVNVYSNVRNGYGIFSLSTSAVDTLR